MLAPFRRRAMPSTSFRPSTCRNQRSAGARASPCGTPPDVLEDIAAYPSSVARPADFDAFWAETLAELATIPLRPDLAHVSLRSTDEVEVFEIHYDSLDHVRIAGWYCVPRAAYRPPPYPALLIMRGYSSEPTLPRVWAR